MKNSYDRVKWLMGDAGLCGISFGSAPTAEHGRGYKALAAAFGCEEGPEVEYDALRIKQLPAKFGFKEVEFKGKQCFLLSSDIQRAEATLGREFQLHSYTKPQYTEVLWDDRDFAILSHGPDIEKLKALAEHFTKLEVLSGSFMRSVMEYDYEHSECLIFTIAPKIAQAVVEDAIEGCKLVRIVEETGIRGFLYQHRLYFKHLNRARWAEGKKDIEVYLESHPKDKAVPEGWKPGWFDYDAGWYALQAVHLWSIGEKPLQEKQ